MNMLKQRLSNIWTIARKDYTGYFTSPIAYIVMAAFLAIMGWMFYSNLAYFKMQSFQFQNMNMGKSPTITEGIIQPLFGNMNVILLLILPSITMRLFAEEKKLHTIELLLTAPLTLGEIILGKFTSAAMFLATMLAVTGVYPLILLFTGNPDAGPLFTNILGTFLMGCCVLSVGVLCSAVTENQIVAGVLAFSAGISFWLVSWASQWAGPVWGDVLGYLSLISHYNNFARGLLSTADLLYYFSFIGTGLFLTHRILDSYRWR